MNKRMGFLFAKRKEKRLGSCENSLVQASNEGDFFEMHGPSLRLGAQTWKNMQLRFIIMKL